MLERCLRDLVLRLPPVPRVVVLLRYQDDLDPPEIARTLGVPLNTVKSHLKRCGPKAPEKTSPERSYRGSSRARVRRRRRPAAASGASS